MADCQHSLQSLLDSAPSPLKTALQITLPAQSYQIISNHAGLLDTLHDYFGRLASWCNRNADIDNKSLQTIQVYVGEQANKLIAQTSWEDWIREAGKSGRKDAVLDTTFHQQSIRLLYKVKTGILFIQPAGNNPHSLKDSLGCMAFGAAEQHPNQIINFILTQYLNQHLRQNWLLGHAAGLQIQQLGVAIAGLSGGGKSTLMLHLLEVGEHFISNDRLLFNTDSTGRLIMRGIPKQPRINPGTIVHNPRLHSLMSDTEKANFLAMPSEQLRALELKYDAPVDTLYGKNCYQPEAHLDYLIILNWSPSSDLPTSLRLTTLATSPQLIPALMKSPGPFYSDANGQFLRNGIIPDAKDYRQRLGQTPVLELNGKVDFAIAKRLILEHFATTE